MSGVLLKPARNSSIGLASITVPAIAGSKVILSVLVCPRGAVSRAKVAIITGAVMSGINSATAITVALPLKMILPLALIEPYKVELPLKVKFLTLKNKPRVSDAPL